MRVASSIILLAALIAGCMTGLAAEDSLLRQIQGVLIGKPVVLRNFYTSDELTYDSRGGLVGNAVKGTRLADGSVRIDKASLRGSSLELAGERLLQYYGPQGESLNAPTGLYVRLRADLPSTDWAAVNQVLQRIFYRDEELTVDTPPSGKQSIDGRFENCAPSDYSSTSWRRVPGKCVDRSSIAEPIAVGRRPDGTQVFVITKALKPPQVISTPEPQYTGEARKRRITSSVVFRAVVDQYGRVDAMQLVQPAGYGLDQAAALALAEWTFAPARLGDQPVAVLMTVGVQFHP